MVLPILEDLSTVLEDKVTIAKVNIESEAGTELAARFAVRGIPTMITFNEGTQQKVKVGAASKPDIISLITESAGE
jgi:thioredoxin 1